MSRATSWRLNRVASRPFEAQKFAVFGHVMSALGVQRNAPVINLRPVPRPLVRSRGAPYYYGPALPRCEKVAAAAASALAPTVLASNHAQAITEGWAADLPHP